MIKGSCHCGAVRLAITGPITQFHHCHCHTCRKFHGSVYGSSAIVAADDFSILSGENDLTAYRSAPHKVRCFCRHCGSHVFAREDGTGEIILRVGTLEDGHGLSPEGHIYVSDKVPWSIIADTLPQYDGGSDG